MSNCGTCKHWEAVAYPPDLADEDGRIIYDETNDWESTPVPGKWGWCKRVAEFGPTLSDKFYVKDGSGYAASLNCREDFGCVEFEGPDSADA